MCSTMFYMLFFLFQPSSTLPGAHKEEEDRTTTCSARGLPHKHAVRIRYRLNGVGNNHYEMTVSQLFTVSPTVLDTALKFLPCRTGFR